MQRAWIRAVTTGMTLGMMILIFVFSMEPAERSDATSGIIALRVADVLRPGWQDFPPGEKQRYFNEIQHVIRKCAHFTEFTLLGVSLRLCMESWMGRRKGLTGISWAAGTLYAGLDELHQLAVDGRSGQWTDVMIDSAGVMCGILIAAGLLMLLRKKGTAGAPQ